MTREKQHEPEADSTDRILHVEDDVRDGASDDGRPDEPRIDPKPDDR